MELVVSPLNRNLLAAGATGLAIAVAALLSRYARRLRLPPGPRGLPVVGNLYDMPQENGWLVYTEWAKKFGDLMCIRIFSQPIVILNSARDVRDLLIKQGTNFADRMHTTMPVLCGWENSIVLIPRDKFRIMKKFTAKYLGPQTLPRAVDVAEKEVTGYLTRQYRQPGSIDPRTQIKRMMGGTILRFAYGYQVQSDNDKFVLLSEKSQETFFESTSPGWAVDAFPLLQYLPSWLPGMGFKRTAESWREIADQTHHATLGWTKKEIDAGRAEPSVAGDLLSQQDDGNQNLHFSMLGDFYSAGTDTTVSACLTLIINLALHPEILAKARREVDSVTQGLRLPVYSDRASLPFVSALVKEAYRFGSIAPLGLPHRSTQETEYKGFRIPNGTIVYANVWAIFHNPNKYPDPFVFKPERYLDENGSAEGTADEEIVNEDPTKYVFGFGPRQCPGRFIAEAVVFLLAAKLAAGFDISDPRDDRGEPISPGSIEYTSSFISRPEAYKCTIKPREKADGLFLDPTAA